MNLYNEAKRKVDYRKKWSQQKSEMMEKRRETKPSPKLTKKYHFILNLFEYGPTDAGLL